MRHKWSICLLLLSLVFHVLLCCGCEPGLQEATDSLIREAQDRWKSNPVSSYSIVVDVQRGDDLRRNRIVVQNGKIQEAFVLFRGDTDDRWTSPKELTESQALPFTVPGLFETIREELDEGHRSDIRVSMKREPAIPEIIRLGPVIQNQKILEGTKTYIYVREFRSR